MKNVCFFNSTMFWGGGEKAHLEYAVNFRNAGYNVCLVCSSGSVLEEKAKKENLSYFNAKIGKLSFLNPAKHKALSSFFTANNIDTVFLNASSDIKLGGPAARKARVKNIVYMRGLAVPVKNSFLNKHLFSKVITHVVPNSYETRNTFLTHLRPLLSEENVPMIYRGINFDDWDKQLFKKRSYKDKDEIILGNVGRLVAQKGQKHLIELAQILRKRKLNFKIVIAGTGPLKKQLDKLISDNKLDKYIKMIGFEADVKSYLNAIDIFVFPSLWEGFGNAMVEAMVEKKVPVAFKLTSNPEIINNGKNGFMVEYTDMELFADKVEFLIRNPIEREQMGTAARTSVRKKFALQKIITDWEKLLN